MHDLYCIIFIYFPLYCLLHIDTHLGPCCYCFINVHIMKVYNIFQETFFVIYALRFGCRYNLKMQMTNIDGEVGEVSQLTFGSPTCDTVKVIGPVRPDCPSNGKWYWWLSSRLQYLQYISNRDAVVVPKAISISWWFAAFNVIFS